MEMDKTRGYGHKKFHPVAACIASTITSLICRLTNFAISMDEASYVATVDFYFRNTDVNEVNKAIDTIKSNDMGSDDETANKTGGRQQLLTYLLYQVDEWPQLMAI